MPGTTEGTRVIALVGPAGAGKTSLAEALLFATGAIDRQGSTANGSTVGDHSPEARARGGSTELNTMHFDYKGEHFALLDSPGSIGFAADGARAVAVADLRSGRRSDPARPRSPPIRCDARRTGRSPHHFRQPIDQARGRIRDSCRRSARACRR